ncbi:TetR family transcriptional regulator [Mycolicibacterium sp. P9-22]|uniref:TetR family transcriptional regulator n=1 Tax=Mycolicibacterium sp. P9-22 TaxID=2024613 RepID=UPI0011EF95C7|nr:TetR family transcriptional regulator [Mycolicibacterium sp. P9-22]KAA0113949.1 TetR/AcrR family transcriptional regulator [Mycolicibacterium sp. P9-22]
MYDSQATRRRLIEAGTAEFAAHGIAGARVDRIAVNARANKAQIYTHFGSKDGLFDAVFAENVDVIINSVPIDGQDLPGYAVRLYDASLAQPEMVRLATWARLERVPVGDLVTDFEDQTARKLQAIVDAQRSGHVDPELDPSDVLSIVTTMALTWSPASLFYAVTDGDPEADHDRRRRALAETVRRAVTPPK